ncbi:MAG: alpha/beta hydrolase [Anaerolineae bacterium]|nr:alpha/beta hydrolase [Anaerolineae bacterium]
MDNLRIHGPAPYRVAVIHGGPGAPGSMAPVARELARKRGVLELLQTADSLDGQVEELRTVIETYGDQPLTLIGWSWGAMLSFVTAAHHPALVNKLILVGCGGFEAQHGAQVMETRLSRLSTDEKSEMDALYKTLDDPGVDDKNKALARLGALFKDRTDTYSPLTLDAESTRVQYNIHQRVWRDAEQLRANGALLQLGTHIQCPVVAIHGDYDPHPADGVREPLARVLSDFRFIMLKNCGHYPWNETEARDSFFEVLEHELI